MFTSGTNAPGEPLQEKFVNYIKDVYAMEDRFNYTLGQYSEQLKSFKEFPEFRAKISQCTDACKPHLAHIASRLNFYKVQPPTLDDTFSPFMSPIVSCFTSVKPQTIAGFAATWYTMEQFKIASYRLLTTFAQAYGDTETVRVAEEHLREEVETQRWIFEKLPEVCLFSLQHENVPVPQTAWDFARQLELVGTTTNFPIPR